MAKKYHSAPKQILCTLEHQGNMILSQAKSKQKQQGNTINGQHKQLKEQEMFKKN